MMKKYDILAYSLLGGLTLLAAGCVKEVDMNEKYRPEGTPIIFSAGTGYENGDGTRTEYSGSFWSGGSDVTSQGLSSYAGAYERIDWVSNDPMTIYYKHPDQSSTNANYKVSGNPSANEEISDASIVVDNSQQLVWAGGGGTNSHVFTAMYPKYNFGGNTGISFDGTNVNGYIPAAQTLRSVSGNTRKFLPQMQYAYMVAYKAIDGNSNEHTVALPFKPAYTAFEFHFRKPANAPSSYKVTAFEMSSSSSDLAGGFAFAINGGDSRGATWGTVSNWTNYTRSRSISVSFGAGVTLSDSDDMIFTLLALPTNLSDITLKLTYNDGTTNGITKAVTLSNTFTACKKYIISNSKAGAGLEYIIEEIDDIVTYGHNAVTLNVNNIKSYRRGVDGTIEAVSWMAQYWDGTQWQTWNSQQGGFSLNSYTGNGVSNLANSETRNVSLIANTQKETVTKTSTEILQEATPVTNYDLSMHDIFGNEREEPTTANCYVISAPGTYRFPCVYGNAITNGSTNYESFAPGRSPSSIASLYTTYVADWYDSAVSGQLPIHQYQDVNYNRYFRNAVNKEITNPYIIPDINAKPGYTVDNTTLNVAIVWQDEQIMTDSDFSLIDVDGNKYIEFSISSSTIKPGNIVVALRGAVGGSYNDSKTILWSWQLWITERDLTPIDGIMPSNLGWNKVYNGSQKYTDRTLPIRLIQIAPSDDPYGAIDDEEFTVTQLGDSEHIGENVGTNPYYQWGRKDPMIPGIYGGSNVVGEPCSDKTIYPGNDYLGMTSYATLIATNSTPAVADYGTAIRNPHVVYIAGQHAHYGTTSWISGYVPTWSILTGDGGKTGGIFQGERIETAIPYNLWNSYCIGYGIPGTNWSSTTKFKTVYDPCPPGFTVPHRGLQGILGSGTDAPDHSGKYFSSTGGAVQFLPYSGARIFYNTSGVIPGTNVTVSTAGIYLRHVAGSTNEYGLYWTDCPTQFQCTTPGGLLQPAGFELGNYTGHFYSQMYLFTSGVGSEDTMDYTKGTAGTIRPMVDPRY